jgi:hypothetical protein
MKQEKAKKVQYCGTGFHKWRAEYFACETCGKISPGYEEIFLSKYIKKDKIEALLTKLEYGNKPVSAYTIIKELKALLGDSKDV